MKFLKLFFPICFVAQIASFGVFAIDENSTSPLKTENKICKDAVKQILDYQPTTVLGDLAREVASGSVVNLGLLTIIGLIGYKFMTSKEFSTFNLMKKDASVRECVELFTGNITENDLKKGLLDSISNYEFWQKLFEPIKGSFIPIIIGAILLQLVTRVNFDKLIRKTGTIDDALDVLLKQNLKALKMSKIDFDELKEKILQAGDKWHVLRWIYRINQGVIYASVVSLLLCIKMGFRKEVGLSSTAAYLILYFVIVWSQSASAKTKVRLEKLRQLRAMLKVNNDSSEDETQGNECNEKENNIALAEEICGSVA